ncbi:membrane-associated progesterone receptor component 1 [Diprion similis]|uniref:membrane-associated progesterone receptor component 1 n=1 Tax=Diprion similis TaxID=362088 RepID=UPI001EF966BF|nr:membrane-associated progesterone receptor component 1 [Diprion similis]
MAEEGRVTAESGSGSLLTNVISEIFTSPINLVLVGIIALLVYKIFKHKTKVEAPIHVEPELPKLKRDFTVEQLKQYDGNGPDKRILMAVNGSVYDVTRGRRFYGPGGPYAAFAGRDASRGLATFSVVPGTDKYDDLSDFTSVEMDSVREWEEQFKEKYEYVGRLLKPGELPTNYSDEEEEGSQQEVESKSKDN